MAPKPNNNDHSIKRADPSSLDSYAHNHKLFAKTSGPKICELVEDLRKYAVVMPVVTLPDGTVISGQARLSRV